MNKKLVALIIILLGIAYYAGYSIRQAKLADVPQVKRVMIKEAAFEVFYQVHTFPNGECNWSLDIDARRKYEEEPGQLGTVTKRWENCYWDTVDGKIYDSFSVVLVITDSGFIGIIREDRVVYLD